MKIRPSSEGAKVNKPLEGGELVLKSQNIKLNSKVTLTITHNHQYINRARPTDSNSMR